MILQELFQQCQQWNIRNSTNWGSTKFISLDTLGNNPWIPDWAHELLWQRQNAFTSIFGWFSNAFNFIYFLLVVDNYLVRLICLWKVCFRLQPILSDNKTEEFEPIFQKFSCLCGVSDLISDDNWCSSKWPSLWNVDFQNISISMTHSFWRI